jgi:acyl carrier protein
MKGEEIQSRVFDIIRFILADPGRSLSLTDDLTQDLRIQGDDLSFLLVPRLEKTFGIRVPVREWEQVYTIGDVANLVARHTHGSENP